MNSSILSSVKHGGTVSELSCFDGFTLVAHLTISPAELSEAGARPDSTQMKDHSVSNTDTDYSWSPVTGIQRSLQLLGVEILFVC